MALQALDRAALAGTLNLRTLNPYVATALAEWRRKEGPQPAAPRQLAPGPLRIPAGQAAAGASSFGMSGTNAHVLLTGGVGSGVDGLVAPPATWKRQR